MAVRQIFSAGPGHPPARQPGNPSAAIPFPARCPAGVWRVLMSAAPLSFFIYYTKACPPCQGNRKTESPCPHGTDLVALPKPRRFSPCRTRTSPQIRPKAAGGHQKRHLPQQMPFLVEQVKGVEPSYQAWEACVLPMNYTCVETLLSIAHPQRKGKRELRRYCISLPPAARQSFRTHRPSVMANRFGYRSARRLPHPTSPYRAHWQTPALLVLPSR